jgi:saccharopine dehydrogenase-like NADP-dependent oxidoreductase
MKTKTGKKVLLLGAGMVTRPGVSYLLDQGFEVTVASRTVSKAQELVTGRANGHAVAFTIEDTAALHRLDLAVSLLPAPNHPKVAEACLAEGTHLVTTSYVGPAMQAFDDRAKAAGLLFLNEIGLDPGIDHMSAMKIIHHVNRAGGRVTSFRSFCGGLPAKRSNTNPWGYKFSWSPRSVMTAGTNSARYLDRGQLVEIPSAELFANHWPVEVPGHGTFEGYPNRDSLGYQELYGLEKAETMLRGTLRYPGWSNTLLLVVKLGLLDQTPRGDLAGQTYAEVLASRIPGATVANLKASLARFAGLPEDSNPIHRLEWAGFLSSEKVGEAPTLLDLVANRLQVKLALQPGDQDLIVLHHEFIAVGAKGEQTKLMSTLVDEGEPDGDSAMARTVSLPAAVAVRLILQGKIALTGVRIPVMPEVYLPVLAELEGLKIVCHETEAAL